MSAKLKSFASLVYDDTTLQTWYDETLVIPTNILKTMTTQRKFCKLGMTMKTQLEFFSLGI